MLSTNVGIISPMEQIKLQKLEAFVSTDEKKYFETDYTLCEDDKISIDVSLEIDLDFHPDLGKSPKKLKVHVLGGYDARENEDLAFSKSDLKELESYIAKKLILYIN
ncbi:hypothetical protein [Chryseobacterium defluvii]|uniref:Uncharacterized protein n=1 Tax=Chryseobacterium defluvii TaxID=160396 RepID=A0A495SLA4_9FLAO|nr:hypothetical protein [Chryseobacterium defluvii]RKT01051.1 hypothetical protein BCF58_0262 [Chryseobacterium defluvii]